MRRYVLVGLLSLACPAGVMAQIRPEPGIVIGGRVVVRVYVTLRDEVEPYHPITGLQLRFFRSAQDSVVGTTDDAGTLTVLLAPGAYRLVSARDVVWKGKTYSWNVPLTVAPGIPAIELRDLATVAGAVQLRANSPERFVDPTTPAVPRAARTDSSVTLSVFLDCNDGCDTEYIRTEIAYVNWVRDRTVADVHMLVTQQDAGGGGDAFTLAFLGQRAAAGRGDTLTFTTNANTTDDEARTGLTRTIALGLVQFVARTPSAQSLRVSMRSVASNAPGAQTTTARDPWKAWVFEIDARVDVSGEQNYRSSEFDGEFNANRTTSQWKVELESQYNYSYERAIDEDFDDEGRLVSADTIYDRQRNYGAELIVVKSLGSHFSAGFRSALGSETFRNVKRRFEFMPALEYNVFNYAEATRRYLAFQIGGGVDDFVYAETTIFDKLSEKFPMYLAAAEYATRQPWGQSNVRLEHRGYLNDLTKRSTQLSGDVSVRLFTGFSVRFGGDYSWIHDQVYLPKGDRDQADVLLRRRALLTGYEYSAWFGITYTFGSIFNNVVNPRFF